MANKIRLNEAEDVNAESGPREVPGEFGLFGLLLEGEPGLVLEGPFDGFEIGVIVPDGVRGFVFGSDRVPRTSVPPGTGVTSLMTVPVVPVTRSDSIWARLVVFL